MNVLFIEAERADSNTVRTFIEQERFPHTAMIATSLQQASDLLKIYDFDAIISDYWLVDGTGFEVFHLAGAIPVIFVTGLGNEEIAVQAMKSGAYDYLVKDEKGSYLRMLTIILEGLHKRQQTDAAFEIAREKAHDLELETERARLLAEFVKDISHDLRTPLSIIHTSLDLLMRYTERLTQKLDNDHLLNDYRHLVERMFDYGNKVFTWQAAVERMIVRMVDMVRLNNAAAFTFLTIDLGPIVSDVAGRFQKQADGKQLQLTIETLDQGLPVAIVDGEFDNMVIYLLENAVKFTPEGGQISVRAYRSGEFAVLEVADTGIGIPEDALPYIFERFFRADKSRPMEAGSNGMGLAIFKRLAEIHHGRIEVESQVNHGSVFRVYLPLTQAITVEPDGTIQA